MVALRFRKSTLGAFRGPVVIGVLLAGSLTACGGVPQSQILAATAAAAADRPTAASSAPGVGPTPVTASTDLAGEIDSELQKLGTDLSNADTLNDLSTALPDDHSTSAPVATLGPTAPPSGVDQTTQLDQMLGTLQDKLNNTDLVPEGANP